MSPDLRDAAKAMALFCEMEAELGRELRKRYPSETPEQIDRRVVALVSRAFRARAGYV